MITYSTSLKNLVYRILLAHPELLNYVRDEKYRKADTDLDYRQIRTLDQADILRPSRENEKEWRTFNLNDLLYIHILKEAKLLQANNFALKQLKEAFYEQTFGYKDIGQVSFSEIALIGLLTEIVPVGILIFSDGDVVLTDDPSTPITLGYFDSKKRKFLFIMLHETFKPYISRVKSDKNFKMFKLDEFEDDYSIKPVTRSERKVIKALNDGECSKIIITKKPSGELLVETEEIKESSKLTYNDLKNVLKTLAFGGIEVTAEEGNLQHLKIKRKQKI